MAFSNPVFEALPIVGILRGYDPALIRDMVPYYLQAGLRTLEITLNSPGAPTLIAELAQRYSGQLNIGAGTVCTSAHLRLALGAGAEFIVTPILKSALIEQAQAAGVPIFVGALTPTEVYHAWELGATMVKVFPAGAMGPGYMRDLKGPLDQVRLLPTGGVGLAQIPTYLAAGADGFGLGSALFDRKLLNDRDWQGLLQHFQQFVKCFPA